MNRRNRLGAYTIIALTIVGVLLLVLSLFGECAGWLTSNLGLAIIYGIALSLISGYLQNSFTCFLHKCQHDNTKKR